MPHGKRRHKIVSPRRERSRNPDEVVRTIVEVNPGLHFYVQGESEFHHGDFGAAIQYFSIALTVLENFPTSPRQLTVKALLRRAQCFFILGGLDQSIRDCTKALNISKMIGFQEGIFEAILLKVFTGEVTGDIRGAFQLAVFLKTLDLKRAISHVRRLREKLEGIFQEDPTLANELGDNLMRTGMDFYRNSCFKEAAEYFTEVIRLVCEFNFVREAYIYQAKYHVKLGECEKARDLCSKVLQRFPEDEDGKTLLENINTKILEQKRESTKKKNSKMASNSPVLEKQVVPGKKRVLNKKQRQYEEYRRKKETEKIGKEIRDQIDKEREKQEQKREKEKTDADGAESRAMPSFDVKAAFEASNSRRETTDKQIKVQAVVVGPGARPKQRKPIETSGKTQDKGKEKKKHKDVGCKKNGTTTGEKSGPMELQPQRQGTGSLKVSHAVEGRRPLPDESSDSKWGVSNVNQTAHTSTKVEHGWTPVTSKKQRLKSVAKSSSSPDWPSLPGPSFVEDKVILQRSNSVATKHFPANRVERQERKSEQKSREHFGRGFATDTEYVPQRSHSASRDLESAGLDSFHSHVDSQRQDLFSTNQESFPDVAFTGLSERRIPLCSSDPPTPFPETRTLDFGKTPISQWECLEQISPLQIHHTLDLANKTKTGVLNTKAESKPPLDADVSPQAELNFSWAPPPGVSTLCEHFLQDNRKGQPFRHPKPCSNCTKRSKIAYGIWKSDTKEWQVMRPYPRDVSPNVPFQLCWHFNNGEKCQKRPCTFAHGIEELKLWTSERQSGRALFGRIASPEGWPQENDFQDIPRPQERVRGSLIIRDVRSNKPRPPPTGVYNGKFQLCKWWKSGRVCRYGTYCTFAHGENELKSWMGYQREIQEAKRKEELSCQKPETTSDISRSEMVYSLPGVEVTCNKPATVKIFLGGDEKRHIFHWEFTVKFEISEVGKLCEIDLLHRYHDCYRLTKIAGFLNNVEMFSEAPRKRWSYNLPSGTWSGTKEGQMKVVISVSFETTTNNQTFTQCIRFDFGKKPFLLQGLNVDIARKEALDTLLATREELKLHSSVWREGSGDIVAWPETSDMSSQDLLQLKKYKLPERIENVIPAQIIEGEMTVHNYKRVMHQLLFTEELFMKKEISSFVFQNVQLDCQQSIRNDWSGVAYAGSGESFGIVKFQDNESLQPDDTASRLLIRNVNAAWIKIAGSNSQKVYETLVQKPVENECVTFKLSSQMCSDLNVSDGGQISVDIQFQLNRKPLCDWHAAIDRLGPIQLSLLFPTPDASQTEQEDRRAWNWMPLDPKLNTNQRRVLQRILAPGDSSSPVVVFGPFGTGKTFTLNQAIRHLVAKKHNRILLCTHTNSAANLHVSHLHDYLTKENGLKATKPLRIWHTNRRLNADLEVARMYGLRENNAYVLPTRDDVIRHRVVITTLATSKHLLELQLNHGFFTHILVDEAAQALEPEALIPLALAGPNTKVVFTGDHMQMGPEVYSHYARDWGLQRSLPERLFDHFCEKLSLDDSVLFLTENYRSHPDILQFPSDNFYGKALIARSEHASHPRFGPLVFFAAHGVEEARENSFINTAEVVEIVKRVKLLADDWPAEWKKKDLSQIGVISAYKTQVGAIREQLRTKGLGNVTVESIHNVQGKEFRALFISTVRTSLTCQSFDRCQSESKSLYWEFLSDPKLLNTAITRAMSLVAVVGDPVSLCTAGDCRGNWRDYIRRCYERRTLHGASYEEIIKKIDAPLAKISLNPEANEFVPQSVDVSSKELKSLELVSRPKLSDSQISRSVEKTDLEVDKNVKGSACEINDRCTTPTEPNRSGIETNYTVEADLTHRESTSEEEEEAQMATHCTPADFPKDGFISVKRSEDLFSQQQGVFASHDEPQSRFQSQEEEDDVGQSASGGFEELPRESFEDETVFPRYLDKIIKALVEKCKATKEREAHPCGSSENEMFPSATKSSKKDSKSKPGKRSGKRAYQEKSSCFDYSSADYEIRVVNGRQEVHIVNLGFHQTPTDRHQRLSAVPMQEDFPDPQILQRLLVEEPDKYLRCTLRLNSEIIRTAYAEISDTKTPDIKIRGRVRGAFDMDHVVVEKTDCQPFACDGPSRYQGKVAGVLNHIISPHERQYVCKVDYENPGVMIPINKSMSKIVNLSHNNLNGLPIYRERQDKSERPFEVDVMDFTEALSGKFLFLVQYLHWRPQYQSPSGIVIRKLTQGNTLSDSMKILFAEHGVRDRFSKASVAEVQTKFPPGWSIPVEEERIREKIEGAFTIDPDNSKDLDDALTLKQLPDSVIQVGVHIADVSYFVEPGTELDKDAMFRSTSYYPGHGYQSVPMLPRELSENHCSLLPSKDRLCVSVFLDVSEDGKLVGQPEIRRTIVRSCCQLTYTEAQKVIDSQDTSLLQIPQNVKGNIRTLSALAQRRRKLRLRDASLDRWSNSDCGEDFEAHELVEEMMLLANEEIAKFLSTSQQISERAPLRTQLPPKDHKLDDWVRQHGQFTKYSLFLRGFYSEETLSKMANKAIISEPSEFKVQESVWSELCNAAETGDQAKLHKLICNESNHPQLAVTNSQFRRIQPKSQYICKSDQPEENVAHFSLGMACYTQFTSPIRRYIDLQVHRLVRDVISQSPNAKIPSKDQVAKVCRRSTFAQDNSNKFEKASKKVHLAAKLKDKSHETTAVIALIDTDKEFTLEILNREYNHLSTRQRKVRLSSLNPFAVELVQNGLEIVLTWKLRLYMAPKGNVIEELEKERKKITLLLSEGEVSNREVLNLPAKNWLEIVQAFQEGDYENVKTMIRQTERVRRFASPSNRHGKPHKASKDEKADTNLEHFCEKKLSLRKFDIVSIQLTAHMTHGVFHPEIQLFRINPSVNICIEHRKYPRDCFSTTARYQASRKTYACVEQYIEAWKPVLAMEAATSTVEESDEFTIYHLKIAWKKDISGKLEGSFSLPDEYCSSRQIEFHAGDFVCVRVRGDSYMKKSDSESNFAPPEKTETEGRTNLLNEDQFSGTGSIPPSSVRGKPHHEPTCASESFWVGHCVINRDYTKDLSDKVTLKVATMDLHHSASVFPEEMLNGAEHLSALTVIHRPLPHRRMFAALSSLPSASQLAHSICMGHEPNQGQLHINVYLLVIFAVVIVFYK